MQLKIESQYLLYTAIFNLFGLVEMRDAMRNFYIYIFDFETVNKSPTEKHEEIWANLADGMK